jgi:Cdc6-like AAA superfamily ATPase
VASTPERLIARRRIMQAFSPGAPIDDRTLFAGRLSQLEEVFEAISQRGQHVIIFGERGVGKTSLANVVTAMFAMANTYSVKVNCDTNDSFSSIWRKSFREIEFTERVPGMGFVNDSSERVTTLDRFVSDDVSPEDVRYLLQRLNRPSVFVIDEADRISDKGVLGLLADTIKALSDHSTPATVILVGVADNVQELISEHLSVERALVQVRMPRMSKEELSEIIERSFKKIRFTIIDDARQRIVLLSEGLPHYTHLLGLNAALSACDEGRKKVLMPDVHRAGKAAIEKAQQSIRNAYYRATTSPQKETLYAQVLLACALTEPDGLGFFAASDIREPIAVVTGKRYEIPSFSRHLNDFCEPQRGPVLEKAGTPRRYRFRFVNPLMQPYVIMHGLAHQLISEESLNLLGKSREVE